MAIGHQHSLLPKLGTQTEWPLGEVRAMKVFRRFQSSKWVTSHLKHPVPVRGDHEAGQLVELQSAVHHPLIPLGTDLFLH